MQSPVLPFGWQFLFAEGRPALSVVLTHFHIYIPKKLGRQVSFLHLCFVFLTTQSYISLLHLFERIIEEKCNLAIFGIFFFTAR